MAKKPVEPPDRRQRSFEGDDEGEWRGRVRDHQDEWEFRKRVWRLIRVAAAWIGATGLGMWLAGKEIITALFPPPGGAP